MKPLAVVAGLAALLALVDPRSGFASCSSRPIAMSEQAYADALLKRMRALGVKALNRVGESSGRDHYAAMGAAFSTFLTPQGAGMKEIGFVLSEPSDDRDTQALLTAAAFTLARLSGMPEVAIRSQLAGGSANHASGTWSETFGPAVAVFVRSGDGTVVKMGLLTCS